MGIGKIYDADQINKELHQPYFEREYNLKYSTGVGNVFLESTLQYAEELGRKYRDRPVNETAPKAMGIDIGYGSSKTSFVVIECILDGKDRQGNLSMIIRVLHSEQHERSTSDKMQNRAYELIRDYKLNIGDNRIYIDGSAPEFIQSIKGAIGEDTRYKDIEDMCRREKRDLFRWMPVLPVNFGIDGRRMLEKTKAAIDKGLIAIDPEIHKDLLTELRLASADETFNLEKEKGGLTYDLLDAFRLAFEYIKL